MNYATIRNHDIANGEGVRTSLFVSGCTNHCPGCFNPEAQDFNYGQSFTIETHRQICKMLNVSTISGLSILVGDPLCQTWAGLYQLISLCEFAHKIGKTVWLWTGFVWEDVMSERGQSADILSVQNLLRHCDVVVDGPFIEAQADRALKWRGSANQRVIDVHESIMQGQIILYER